MVPLILGNPHLGLRLSIAVVVAVAVAPRATVESPRRSSLLKASKGPKGSEVAFVRTTYPIL